MQDAVTLLEEILAKLKKSPADLSGAQKQVRDLIIKGPCDGEMAQIKTLVDTVLEHLVKPSLEKSHERQSQLSRLQKEISKQREPDLNKLKKDLEGITPWITEPQDWDTLHQKIDPQAPPPRFRTHLCLALNQLSEGDPWLEHALQAMPDDQEPDWKVLFDLLTALPDQELKRERRWQRQKSDLMQTLQRLAETLSAGLKDLGQADGETDALVERLKQTPEQVNVQELKQVLIQEADGFRRHAKRIHRQLDQSSQRLLQARDRLKQMDEALQSTRDDNLQDPFTGLPNRFALSAHLQRLMERQQHLGHGFAVIGCQVDHLAAVLNKLSESKRHRLVVALAARMSRLLDEGEWLARREEERFYILLNEPELGMARAQALAQMFLGLREALNAPSLRIRASFSVVRCEEVLDEKTILERVEFSITQARTLDDGVRVVLYEGEQTGV
ncbi:GGDEF domain-containing protein [Magnetococcus sp. PR-3]|uniref:GGDEF domain-containing protein n=1 Tax=Magnetococcus sp. PR-3 TaxID=3120355 RepID=UPI002FCE54DF